MLDKVIGWIIPFCCGSVISAVTSYFAFGRAMCEGLKCLLRAEIIRSHDKYIGRGYCPIYAKEALKRAAVRDLPSIREILKTLDGTAV